MGANLHDEDAAFYACAVLKKEILRTVEALMLTLLQPQRLMA